MNYPGVLAGAPDCLAKLAAFQGRHIDGHSPLLRGMDLNGYLAAGIRTDHECTGAEEALEKLSKGHGGADPGGDRSPRTCTRCCRC
jgi:adenine deaminase